MSVETKLKANAPLRRNVTPPGLQTLVNAAMNLARPRGSIPPPVAPPGCGSALRRDTGHSTRIGPADAGSWRPCTLVAPLRATHNAAFRTQVHNAGSQRIAANCKTPQNTLETRVRNVQRRNGVVTTRVVTTRPWLWQRSLHNATHNAGITRGIAPQPRLAKRSRNAAKPGLSTTRGCDDAGLPQLQRAMWVATARLRNR